MENELNQYLVIFGMAASALVVVIGALFIVAMLREMRLQAEETILASDGFRLSAATIRRYLHYLTLTDVPARELPASDVAEPARRPRTEPSLADTGRQQRVEVPVVTPDPIRTRHAS